MDEFSNLNFVQSGDLIASSNAAIIKFNIFLFAFLPEQTLVFLRLPEPDPTCIFPTRYNTNSSHKFWISVSSICSPKIDGNQSLVGYFHKKHQGMIELCKKEYNILYNIIYTHLHGLSLPYRNLQSRVLAVWGIWMTSITKSDRPSLRLSFMSSSFYKNSFLLAASESDWILFDQWARYSLALLITMCMYSYVRSSIKGWGKFKIAANKSPLFFLQHQNI